MMTAGETCLESSGCINDDQVIWDPVPHYINFAAGVYLFIIGNFIFKIDLRLILIVIDSQQLKN